MGFGWGSSEGGGGAPFSDGELERLARGVPVFRADVYFPLLLHIYPGLTLKDLYGLNLTELGLLIGGLEWVVKWHVMLSPFKDKKTKVKLPEPIDYYYGEDLVREGKIPRDRYLEVRKRLVREAGEKS